jgi:pectinesterase
MSNPLRTVSLLIVLGSGTFAQSLLVTVTNPLPYDRPSETIAVPLALIRDSLGSAEGVVVLREHGSDAWIPSQATDADYLFQASLGPMESESFRLFIPHERRIPAPSKVAGLYALPRQDYAWENDHVAFRVYGPALGAEVNNGIDVWTKRVDYPVVAKWYKESESSPPGHDSYHVDRGEGADYFAVGRSLGAGGSGLWLDRTLVQPGVFRSYKTLADGPVRVSFALTYHWVIGGDSLTEEKIISLDAGQNLNRIETRFDGRAATTDLMIACGLVSRAGTSVKRGGREGWIAMWGPTTSDTLAGFLGTGVVLAPGAACSYHADSSQELTVAPSRIGQPFVYYAGFAWTGRNDVRSRDDWVAQVSRFSESLRTPLTVISRKAP